MSNVAKVFIFLFFGICFLSWVLPGIFFPSDIIQTFPHYTEGSEWSRTQNSILSDPVFQFEPWRSYAKQRLTSGELPFLNGQNALGSPFLANQINALFFPLTLLYYIFPVSISLFLLHFLKFYFLFLFTYLYFRSLQVKKEISLFCAFASTFSAFPIVWLLWPQTNVYLLFPLILYLTEQIKRYGNNQKRWYVFLALSYFLAVLGGHPETLFHIGVIHFFYVLTRVNGLREIIKVFLYILLGFSLSAFLLFPFLEYLLQSYMLEYRLASPQDFYLPLSSSIVHLIPFLFGAPHLEFYKPLWTYTNFQEVIGGYIGPSMLLLGMFAIFKLKKSSLSLFWISVSLVTFGISYAIFPFTLINDLPVFNAGANHRFIGFFGFSVITLAVLFLRDECPVFRKHSSKTVFSFFMLSGLSSVILFLIFPTFFLQYVDKTLFLFSHFLKVHIVILLLSTIMFFISLAKYKESRNIISLVAMYIAVSIQTIGLFYSYNPITSQDEYYPQTALTKVMTSLPQGEYIEVGTPSIQENTNLMYNLSSIENYDALEIAAIRHEFDKQFPKKNHWGNAEVVNQEGLQLFGINYVISDYDVRFKKINIQPRFHSVLDPVLKTSPVHIEIPLQETIKGLRILPATYNRVNPCRLTFSIGKKGEPPAYSKNIACSDLRNNMFYTLDIPPIETIEGDMYVITISTSTSDHSQTVSFFGDGKTPYIDILTDTYVHTSLKLRGEGENWYVFENPEATIFKTDGTVNVEAFEEEYVSLVVDQEKTGTLKINKANYPGWRATVDNVKIQLHDSPFLMITLTPGRHVVEFTYIPYSFYFGLIVSFTSLCCLLYIAGYKKRGSNRQ